MDNKYEEEMICFNPQGRRDVSNRVWGKAVGYPPQVNIPQTHFAYAQGPSSPYRELRHEKAGGADQTLSPNAGIALAPQQLISCYWI